MLPNKPKNNGLASLNRLASPRNNSAKNTGFSAFNTKSNSAKPANSFSNLSFTKAPSAMPDIMPAINKSVNTVQGSLSDLYAPVKESVDEAMENTNSMMTVPVMLGIGILTILLIIITIFRDQIAYGFQVVWEYIKNGYQTTQLPQLPSSSDITSKIDQGAIQNNMPLTKEVFNIAQDKYKLRLLGNSYFPIKKISKPKFLDNLYLLMLYGTKMSSPFLTKISVGAQKDQ